MHLENGAAATFPLSTGIDQGCPSSAVAFALGLRRALESAKLRLAAELPHRQGGVRFLSCLDDLIVHPTINVDDLDPLCALPGLVLNQPKKATKVDTILNNSFGMLGINSTLIVRRFVP